MESLVLVKTSSTYYGSYPSPEYLAPTMFTARWLALGGVTPPPSEAGRNSHCTWINKRRACYRVTSEVGVHADVVFLVPFLNRECTCWHGKRDL